MPVADSSFLVSFFDRTDAHHEDARRRFVAAEHVIISTDTLVETLGVLKTKLGRRAAAAALEDLMQVENVGWEETCDLMAAYRIYQRKKLLSLTDAMVVDLCVKLDTPVFTYDVRQQEAVEEMRG